MPSSVDLSEAVGFIQNGPNYGAMDVRRAVSVYGREGIAKPGDLRVSQRAGGAAMAVDVAAGEALVQGDFVARQGLYYAVLPSALTGATELTVPTAHATLPRIDAVWLEIWDTFHDGDGFNKATIRYVPGTATAGATLANLTGAPTVNPSTLLLANVEVPAGDTTITDSQIARKAVSVAGPLNATFSAYRNAAVSVGAAALVKVPYDTEEWDSHSWFDTTLSRFTPQVAGTYRLSAFQRMVPANAPFSYLFLYLYKNGSLYKVLDGKYPAGNAMAAGGSVLAQANGTTDYFEIFCQNNETTSTALTTGIPFSHFSGESID